MLLIERSLIERNLIERKKIGSEKRGLSGHHIEACDFMVRIPMRGRCDSINVAVAAGILLFRSWVWIEIGTFKPTVTKVSGVDSRAVVCNQRLLE